MRTHSSDISRREAQICCIAPEIRSVNMARRFWRTFRAAGKTAPALTDTVPASQRVLQTYELLEQILLHLPTPRDVRVAYRVNRFWCAVIQKNQALEKKRLKRTNQSIRELHLFVMSTSGEAAEDRQRKRVGATRRRANGTA